MPINEKELTPAQTNSFCEYIKSIGQCYAPAVWFDLNAEDMDPAFYCEEHASLPMQDLS